MSELELKECIGRGRFSEVYRAIWHGTTVAAKKLLAGRIDDRFTSEFEKEVYLMSDLRAPNVLQFLGTVYEPPTVLIVVEYMSRGSLYQVLHDPTIDLSWDTVLSMLADTARGMNYLHECKPPVIHRDLKSHNLLVDEYWRVKVCDFGLSTVMLNTKSTKKKITSSPTSSFNNFGSGSGSGSGSDSNYCRSNNNNNNNNGCGGTPYWTAPEVIKGLPATTKSDVYSFGIVMWECVTRRVPYDGIPPFKVIYAMGTEGIRPRISLNTPFPYSQLMKKCWDDDVDFRPEFSAILEALEQMTPYNWKRIPRPRPEAKHMGTQQQQQQQQQQPMPTTSTSASKVYGGTGGTVQRESEGVLAFSPSSPYSYGGVTTGSVTSSSSIASPPGPPSLDNSVRNKHAQRQARRRPYAGGHVINEKTPLLLRGTARKEYQNDLVPNSLSESNNNNFGIGCCYYYYYHHNNNNSSSGDSGGSGGGYSDNDGYDSGSNSSTSDNDELNSNSNSNSDSYSDSDSDNDSDTCYSDSMSDNNNNERNNVNDNNNVNVNGNTGNNDNDNNTTDNNNNNSSSSTYDFVYENDKVGFNINGDDGDVEDE